MKITFPDLTPTRETPSAARLMAFVKAHSFDAVALHSGRLLGLHDGHTGVIVPASVSAVRRWLGY